MTSQKLVTVSDIKVARTGQVLILSDGKTYQAAPKVAATISSLSARELTNLLNASAAIDANGRVESFTHRQPADDIQQGAGDGTAFAEATSSSAPISSIPKPRDQQPRFAIAFQGDDFVAVRDRGLGSLPQIIDIDGGQAVVDALGSQLTGRDLILYDRVGRRYRAVVCCGQFCRAEWSELVS
jgi:hypothetical protein